MSLSYSCLRTNRNVTLPSVDSWGTNMNILKDPPKSIHTRKIDKVGETQDIVHQIDNSGNRICEQIKVYPRGINPSVSVQYQNFGGKSLNKQYCNNQSSNTEKPSHSGQAYLPYRVVRDGAFRPPILRQEDTMPLSRLPRIWTYAFTNPEFPNFANKMLCPESKKLREIKKNVVRTNIRPTAVSTRHKTLRENFKVKKVINNPVKYSVHSKAKYFDKTIQENMQPSKGIDENKLDYVYQSKISQNIQSQPIDVNNIDQTQFIIDDPTQTAVVSNINKNQSIIQEPENLNKSLNEPIHFSKTAPINRSGGNVEINDNILLEKNLPNFSSTTNIVSNLTQNGEINGDYILEKNTPLTHMTTNITGNGKTDSYNITRREYSLTPKIGHGGGGVNNMGVKRSQQRILNFPENVETEKSKMSKKVFETMMGRQ